MVINKSCPIHGAKDKRAKNMEGICRQANSHYQSLTIKKEKPAKRRSGERKWLRPVGISSIAVGTILLGTMGYFTYSAFDNNKKYENSDKITNIKHYIDKRDNAVTGAIITGIIGGILVPSGAGLLLWEYKTDHGSKTASIYPVTGETNGFLIVMRF